MLFSYCEYLIVASVKYSPYIHGKETKSVYFAAVTENVAVVDFWFLIPF